MRYAGQGGMYIWNRPGLEGWHGPTTLTMRPKPDVMLNQFEWNESKLTPRLATLVNNFADAVIKSQQSAQPIVKIRLVGHTDDTGDEKYNRGLGDRRAAAVERVLRARLKSLPAVQIVVTASPGELEPQVENDSKEHRAQNRRVEVFVTTAAAPPPPTVRQPPGPNLWDFSKLKLPPEPIIKTTPSTIGPNIPPGPARGRSVAQWLDEVLSPLPGWLARRIRDAVLNGACAALEMALAQAGARLTDKQKEDLRKECLDAANRKVK
jgi:hypothetical protein